MGEESWRVKTVGFIDLIKQKILQRGGYKNLKLDFKNPIIIFTQHSVTTEFSSSAKQIQQSLIAIKNF